MILWLRRHYCPTIYRVYHEIFPAAHLLGAELEQWDCEMKTAAILAGRNGPDQARVAVDRVDRIGRESRLWQKIQERLARGSPSCGDNAPLPLERMANGITAKVKSSILNVSTPPPPPFTRDPIMIVSFRTSLLD